MTKRFNTMLRLFILPAICAIFQSAAGRQISTSEYEQTSSFKYVKVKKRIGGKICDTCRVDFAHNAEPHFSYVITGAGNTPNRFYPLMHSSKPAYKGKPFHSSTHLISEKRIGITFLPNFLKEAGKTIQLYRNFGGDDYTDLEFSAEHNGRVIKPWTAFFTLGEDKEHAILGEMEISGRTVSMPWKRTFFAGNFNLNVKDSLDITVRNAQTKKIIQKILLIRAEDRATNFVYYQMPLIGDQFSINLQEILNISSDIPKVYHGDSVKVFWKDYASIGLIRFIGLERNEVVQYSFEKKPYMWKSVSSINSENGVFIILGNDMRAGTYQNIYLRYKSQPETVHRIRILVKKKPFEIPWGKIAAISILLLAASIICFYLWNKRNKQRLAVLRSKNQDIETRLSLLSGQLNPHFLFNSLNAIQGTINSGNPDRANAYIGNVAGFMRDVMDNGRKEFVSLQEEFKIEEDYLRLEQERMAFNYVINIAPGLNPSLIDFPPLLLQPILENSIRHAFGAELPDPKVAITVSSVIDALRVEITDNGRIGWDPVGTGEEGYGLSLIRKRIAVYNEKLDSMSIKMQINYQSGRGTITTFTFKNWLV